MASSRPTSRGEGGVDSAMVDALCDRIQGNTGSKWLRFQCVHGIGHGLEMVWNWDLPRALAGCDWLGVGLGPAGLLRRAPSWRTRMASMPGGHHTPARAIEAVQGKAATARSRAASMRSTPGPRRPHVRTAATITFKMRDSTDLLYPCTAVDFATGPSATCCRAARSCTAVGSDFAKAAAACDRAQADLRQNCYLSLGTARERDDRAEYPEGHPALFQGRSGAISPGVSSGS